MKTIVYKLIKFSEDVGIGIFSYCAKLCTISVHDCYGYYGCCGICTSYHSAEL